MAPAQKERGGNITGLDLARHGALLGVGKAGVAGDHDEAGDLSKIAVDVRAVGRELGVRSVLEGSIRRAGQRVRITAQLIDAVMMSSLMPSEKYSVRRLPTCW